MTYERQVRGCVVVMTSLLLLVTATGILAATATAKSSVAPNNTAAPSISGSPREGQTLTASNGTWDNSPTSFGYQWQRCGADGTGCAGISGATSKSYQLASADVDHKVRVIVTATNADGNGSANSSTSPTVAASNGPTNTAKPTISGSPSVGEQLSASNGTWTGGAGNFTYQWQSCSTTNQCANIVGATGQTYNVRSADIGSSVRVEVTAHSASGSASALSDTTAVVASSGGTTTVVQTAPGSVNRAPTISFVSLKRLGGRIYARFHVCDDSPKVTVVERDTKAKVAGYTRRFAVRGCATFARNWLLIARFNHAGRFTVTLRAVDKSQKTSRPVSRSLLFR